MSFPQVSPKQSFPALESEVLAYWKANNTFQKSIDSRPEDNPYRFYDGPPFITGTPHYGSLLSSVVKDVVGRYWTMRGRRVDRVWGWDCHGLPIEEKVQKKLGLKSNREIEERGVKEFIDGCYEYTQSTSAEWDWYIDKIGRWVDMDKAYRTMDQEYMESVMWVFSQLWNKGLIYEGKRVSLYSWKLSTPISNFEVAMDDTYQEVNDPAITVKFELEPNDRFLVGAKVLAWTTTPWTIPANMALAVRNDIDYILVENSSEQFIVAKNRAESVFKGKGEYTVIREFKGSELVGLGYVPPFPEYYYQKHGEKNHKIYHADFITDTDGTGIGHEAPEFGDVDFQLAKKEGIFISEAMDEAGKYTSQIFDYEGTHYLNLEEPEKGANRINIERMKVNNTLFKLENITHRVPFCPRSGTPLMQKAQSSWFIDIQSQKEKLLKANEQINWFPEHLKFGRFAKGIESAPDWCISRTRFWGAPMPVWMGEDGEKVVVSSREEIFERNKPYGQLTKVIFVRHGETDYNQSGKIDPLGKGVLTEKGDLYAKNLANQLQGISIDAIYCSSLSRSIETTKYISDAVGVDFEASEELKEWQIVSLQEKNWESVGSKEEYSKWGNTPNPGDESIMELYERVSSFLQKVIRENPGKTIVISSHHFAILCMQKFLHNFDWNTEAKKYVIDNTSTSRPYQTEYVFSQDATLFNLHKPYIDSIFLAPEQSEKPNKVLGVHGRGSDIQKDSWKERREIFANNGMSLDLFQFDKSEDPAFESWKQVFDGINFSDYDAIYTSSLGGVMTARYLAEKGMKVPRIIMVAPGISHSVASGIKPNIQAIYDSLSTFDIKNIADEIVVLHAKDDDTVPFENGKNFAEKLGASFVATEAGNHMFKGQYQLIAGLLKYGSPLTRIPEVLDVWMDSGSMPYAQMHYPFENKGEMEASFPADFIAEYVGQVRAWFYVMHVLGVLLNPNNEPKPTPSFTNVITTGVINGNDGRKMSKSYGNYPDPRLTIEKYGADPIRFYMLNSPLLSGGDMDFKEEQIIETVKGVMLPIWNTYSFFTTYANIDQWQHDETEVWYMRHAETTSNASNTMSDGTDDPELTEKGREEAKNAGKTFLEQGKNFDIIIHTGLRRTDDTARIVGAEIGFSGEYMVDSRFLEQAAGEYAGKTLQEIADMHDADVGDHPKLRSFYKNNSTENIEQFEERILTAYQDILEKYHGKRVLIVAHAGTPRPMIRQYFGRNLEDAHYNIRTLNAEPFRLMTTPLVNELDRWILSRLQVLMGQVHDAMDGYDVSRACRAIVDYMDELTNWYVRLSRRRFWGSEMTADKRSAYETLYTVLTETSKLLAPYMPFMSEDIYRGLTRRESVHLEYITRPSRHLVDNDLNRDMEICEHIVSLGLALRSRKNIRVRQPLQSVTITKELSEYYQAIIRDELNVKEVRYENPEKLAKKICKPDARKIGPKYGKDVQKVIMEAKNGNFVEKENGIIDVGGFILEAGEYVIEYLPLEGVGDVEGGYGIVISLDTTITESLRLEGYARDIIRAIQEMRKEADYQVTDRITLHIYGERHEEILASYGDMIQSETLSSLAPLMVAPDLEKSVEVDEGLTLTIQIER